jgi:hypothetical protein
MRLPPRAFTIVVMCVVFVRRLAFSQARGVFSVALFPSARKATFKNREPRRAFKRGGAGLVMLTVIAGLLGLVALVLAWTWHTYRSLPAAFFSLFLAGAALAMAVVDWVSA